MSQKASQGSAIEARMEMEAGINHQLERDKTYLCLSEL